MGQALYRHYRPRSLDEVVGQEHITKTLGKALTDNQFSHAYLFTGPKGVGKTSVARILAHEINNLKYDDDNSHIDIIEIDAASNRRIDEIRELRERVYIAPALGKYKVYIIDEVHMLTREAFNALLKTLEEPPSHVVFILATTDAHKLPETIISRTQRFSFKPIAKEQITLALKQIAKNEKILINDDALNLLAEHGEGSLRDSTSLLDQARNYDKSVDVAYVTKLLGLPSSSSLKQLFDLSLSGNTNKLVLLLNQLYDQGYQAAVIAKQLAVQIRAELVNSDSSLDKIIGLNLLAELIEVPASHDPERYLEITLMKVTPVEIAPLEVVTNKSVPKKAASPSQINVRAEFNESLWPTILQALKQKHNTLYGIARMGRPSFNKAGQLDLTFAFDFHQKRLNEAGNKKLLKDVIKELTGQQIIIECHLDKSVKPLPAKSESKSKPQSQDISAINSIFNGAELLES